MTEREKIFALAIKSGGSDRYRQPLTYVFYEYELEAFYHAAQAEAYEKAASQNYRADAIKAEKQRDELLALVKKIKEWDISDFALAIPVGLREEMQRLICEAKGGA